MHSSEKKSPHEKNIAHDHEQSKTTNPFINPRLSETVAYLGLRLWCT